MAFTCLVTSGQQRENPSLLHHNDDFNPQRAPDFLHKHTWIVKRGQTNSIFYDQLIEVK
jgi:hypothetical protein